MHCFVVVRNLLSVDNGYDACNFLGYSKIHQRESGSVSGENSWFARKNYVWKIWQFFGTVFLCNNKTFLGATPKYLVQGKKSWIKEISSAVRKFVAVTDFFYPWLPQAWGGGVQTIPLRWPRGTLRSKIVWWWFMSAFVVEDRVVVLEVMPCLTSPRRLAETSSTPLDNRRVSFTHTKLF